MQPDGIEFASLLCSRLCHDLLSPIGAMNNGLELLADERDPAMRERVVELLAESARTSAAKLMFFRLAFGAAGGFGETIATREAQSAVEGLFGGGRLTVNWLVSDPEMEKSALKVLLNLALIAGDALVRGGQLDLAAEGTEIAVRAEGPRIVLDGELRRLLEGDDTAAPSPRGAPAVLVRSLVAASGGTLQLSGPDDPVLVFGAHLPAVGAQ